MDMVPCMSRARNFVAVSSMANIAGYKAVLEASNTFGRSLTGPSLPFPPHPPLSNKHDLPNPTPRRRIRPNLARLPIWILPRPTHTAPVIYSSWRGSCVNHVPIRRDELC
ncbi:hypothetical protein BKA63DRAFT_524017 [Paraphoma chrysanthemicola]|nr:hypothetical protein BKA63DRAFT_524017 [Paraphoma chrysanthemicola]